MILDIVHLILFRELRPLTHQLLPGRAAITSPGARGEAPQGRVVALEINITSLCVDMFDTSYVVYGVLRYIRV